MNRSAGISVAIIAFLSVLVVAPTSAQRAAGPGRVTVSLYRIAPGKHVDFLKWMAEREAVAKEAGAQPAQLYAHIDGDAWDFMVVAPELEPVAQAELDKKVEAAAKKKGMATGPKVAIEIRQYISWHTDTIAAGPMSAAQAVDAVTK